MKTSFFRNTFFAMAAIIAISTVQLSAQTQAPKQNTTGRGTMFVDKNNDGICDNFNNPNIKRPRDGRGCKNGNGRACCQVTGKTPGVCDGSGKNAGGRGACCNGQGRAVQTAPVK